MFVLQILRFVIQFKKTPKFSPTDERRGRLGDRFDYFLTFIFSWFYGEGVGLDS